jgi:hypothetical protein
MAAAAIECIEREAICILLRWRQISSSDALGAVKSRWSGAIWCGATIHIGTQDFSCTSDAVDTLPRRSESMAVVTAAGIWSMTSREWVDGMAARQVGFYQLQSEWGTKMQPGSEVARDNGRGGRASAS